MMEVNIDIEAEVRCIVAEVLAEQQDGDPWYTTEGAAAYLGTTEGQVRNLRHSDKLSADASRDSSFAASVVELKR